MSFASPFVLAGLVALPALYWLLRAVPPQPRREVFGGMYFLKDLSSRKSQPVRTPPLILIVRMLAFTALILGLAGPLVGDEPPQTEGPVTLLMDDGWDAAAHWTDRQNAARAALEASRGPVTLVRRSDGEVITDLSPDEAMRAIERWEPQPVLPQAEGVLDTATLQNAERLIYIAGGIMTGDEAAYLPRAEVSLPSSTTVALGQVRVTADALTVPVMRSDDRGTGRWQVSAIGADGRALSTESAVLEPGTLTQDVTFRLPLAIRNQVVRLEIDGIRSAGAVELLGASARRTLVGIASRGNDSLREGGFYLTRALEPRAELIDGPIADLLLEDPGMIILDDIGTFRTRDREGLEAFVDAGGVLLRFAGPRLLAGDRINGDPLLPAPVLGGERALGGALTWAEPQRVSRIEALSPIGDLALEEDIAVRRQVLTAPGANPDIWVALADGTPLITARRQGEGLVVLVHVSAVPTWSDFPISGLFAQVLQRLAALAETALDQPAPGADEALPATKLVNGFGALIDAPLGTEPWRAGEDAAPGLYGSTTKELAVNAYDGTPPLRGLTAETLPRGARLMGATKATQTDLGPLLLVLAIILLSADAFLTMTGGRLLPVAAAVTAVVISPLMAPPAKAQLRPPLPSLATEAALDIRFGYIKTGDREVDALSEAGLRGLSVQASLRTALEPAPPQGVDPDRDELSVYPLLYWPIRPGQEPPSDSALQRLEDFMAGGGLLIIDTLNVARPGMGDGGLDDILARFDAPPLEPLGADSVLLFSFYRLGDLEGRTTGGQVWVETRGALDQRRDGVPSLIIGGRDWASAWALDDRGYPLRPAGPGGERRRELAFRAGINMAMVAVTGNYKADQAEVQSMLDRLGDTEDEIQRLIDGP
ncbi:MAG: DUF4159 domain-containing protein [Pseudomonadota bacterium]